MKKQYLKAVHDTELITLLRELKILDSIEEGKRKCKFCECSINIDNLEALFPESGDVKVVCSNIKCLKAMYAYIEEKGINING